MYLRFEEEAPLITVYRTGKYIITGPTSEEELFDLRERFLRFLSDMDVIENATDEWFSVQNSVPHKASSASCFCGLSSVSKRLY